MLYEVITFINHRKTVIIRRTIFDLEKAKARAHILEGLKKALDHTSNLASRMYIVRPSFKVIIAPGHRSIFIG